jgi:hypothetical protein
MKIGTMALIGSAMAVITLGGMTVAACSSSTSPNPVTGDDSGTGSTGQDSGTGSTGQDSGTGSTGEDSGTGSTGQDSGTGTTTCKNPQLHPNPAGDVYCGYASDDAGGTIDCLSDSGTPQCCLGGTLGSGFAPQACVAFGVGNCAADTAEGTKPDDIQCNQISDCTANGVTGAACCLQGTTSTPAAQAGCTPTWYKQSGGKAIACEVSDAGTTGGGVPSCASGEVQVCSSDLDCPTGTFCQAMSWKIFDIGFCLAGDAG